MTYKKRIFGAAIVKAINSNYNADFTGQPRTLPDGTVYATDKAFKYTVKNYLKDVYANERIFYFKRFNEEFVPYSLDDAYARMFPDHKDTRDKKVVARDILSCLDIRLFGATFAKKGKSNNIAISVHGPVQINHGVNIWKENNIYSEQIMSPFRNPDENSDEKQATTLGRQSKLQEGHYLHHFSVNPKNLEEVVKLAGEGANDLTEDDISKLKEAMKRGVTWYDSASKTGSENEALIWIELKEGSKLVLPNLTQLITMQEEKEDGKVVLDCTSLKEVTSTYKNEIEKNVIAFNENSLVIKNAPTGSVYEKL
ncbi:MAG: CRISPR-associated protein Csh2 [Anaerophaga sp.]|uniref:type I CRISPR-associated protein Cas7 n=1 Tax=Anaerophaga thermohalophila TaxID=177400 RepID=UPI00030A64DC|nr:type I CRISPR-associated protein Cas7 [Anaerophaga thermohalophila]MDI3521393.1 CRISPR-associated protein Csh2 [Anaerophaga sp.]MDN5290811.1 CRISPR-associated protein Csh2 [Anaerophaga sp.]